jgi:hypothetical protein
MKTNYIILALVAITSFSFAQTKSSGTVSLGSSITVKIDKNSANSTVTLTMTGPDTKWFGIGFNASSMGAAPDCVYFSTSLIDAKISGYSAPTTDANNDWTLVTNSPSASVRTVVATRDFTGGTGDYNFDYADNSLNIIWGLGPSQNIAQQHASKGASTLNFSVLGTESFPSINDISISPNPSNGLIEIAKSNQISISNISIYDINAKIVKVINTDLDLDKIQLDITSFSKGIYFVEISNETDKIVRKIVIE